jgi:hypothetical protein
MPTNRNPLLLSPDTLKITFYGQEEEDHGESVYKRKS